ncbi:MAG: lactonase family protein [Lapillicoccus sp.]
MISTSHRLLIGGYTKTGGRGIGVVDLEGDRLGLPSLIAEAENPSYVITSPDGRHAYAVLERTEGAVAAWSVGDGDAPWVALGEQPTGGADPCHLEISPDGRFLLSANYSSGSVGVHPIGDNGSLGERSDFVQHQGRVGPIPERQDGPHAHQVVFGPGGHLFVCDLGLDVVITYDLDASGQLSEVVRSEFAAGTGPRNLAFSSDGTTAWLVGELSSTLVTCAVDGARLVPGRPTSTRRAGATADNTPAAIARSQDGSRVLVGNRGDDTIAVFAVTDDGLQLDSVVASGGERPRFVGWGPDGSTMLVGNQRSGSIVVANPHTGEVLSSAEWPSPTCLVVLP